MKEPAISIRQLSKRYRLGVIGHATLAEEIRAFCSRMLGRKAVAPLAPTDASSRSDGRDFWALRDLSLDIQEGEVLGIIGRNGAGKSTLLKVLTRITEPSSGEAVINGRVGSLLEVGTGFHPELTGRENVFMNGAILGMTRREIKAKFDEIVAFSGVEQFLDTPVKRYSSGMYVRLAFAVAAHMDPNVLIVDEVLAVGDAEFQKKCLGKMQEVSGSGRTVLFVSHNIGMIKALCSRAILLSEGRLVADGSPSEVVDRYLKSSGADMFNGHRVWTDEDENGDAHGLHLESISLMNAQNAQRSSFDVDEPIHVEIVYRLLREVRSARMILSLCTADGTLIFASPKYLQSREEMQPGHYKMHTVIPASLLNTGTHYLRFSAAQPGISYIIRPKEVLQFFVERGMHHGGHKEEHWPGVVSPRLNWRLEILADG